MAKYTKILFVTISGERMRVKAEGSEFDTGGVDREDVAGANDFGYTEKPRVAMAKFTLLHVAGTSLVRFSKMTDEDIGIETDTGDQWTMADSWSTGEVKLSDGEVPLEFHCDPKNVTEDIA